MTRIAMSGAHLVGKTTVITAVRNRVAVAGGVIRDMAAAGYGVARETTPGTIEAYVRAQLQSEVLAARRASHIISDRVLVDGLAYVEASARRGEATYPWSATELALLRAGARLHAASFDVHVLIPIEFAKESDLPFHDGGEEFRQQVAHLLEELLSDDWPIPVVRLEGSVAERAAALNDVIDTPPTL